MGLDLLPELPIDLEKAALLDRGMYLDVKLTVSHPNTCLKSAAPKKLTTVLQK